MSAILPRRASDHAAWGLALAIAAVHFLFARASVAVPYVFGDEAGYLTKAAALAGHPTDAYSSYYPGYALLLAPLYAVEPHTLAIYPWVQLLNAALAGSAAWLLLAIADTLAPDRPRGARWLAAAAVGCYAPTLAYSAFALSENLFVPLVLLLAWLLLAEVAHAGRGRAATIALAAAGLMLTHPKGVPVTAALCLGWAAGTWHQGRAARWRALGWSGAALLLFLGAHQLARAFFQHRMGYYSDGISGHYPKAGEVLTMLADVWSADRAGAMAIQFAGQFFYLGVASLGLVLLWLLPRGRDEAHVEATAAARAYRVFTSASLLLTTLMTAFFMGEGARVDSSFYGRYDEGVIALALLPALLRPRPRRAWWCAALAVAMLGLVLVTVHGSVLQGEVVQLNVFGAQLWRFLGAVASDRLELALLALAGTVAIVALGLVARWAALPVLVGVLFLFAAGQGSVGYLRPESRTNAARHRIAVRIQRDFPSVACVDYDIRAGEYWQRYNNQVLLLPARMHETALSALAPGQRDDGRTRARCSDLVISASTDLPRRYPRARLLQRENGSQEGLWWIPRDAPAQPPAAAVSAGSPARRPARAGS